MCINFLCLKWQGGGALSLSPSLPLSTGKWGRGGVGNHNLKEMLYDAKNQLKQLVTLSL